VSWTLAAVALAVLIVAAVSRRLSGGPITPAMLFVALGLIAGPRVLGEVDVPPTGGAVRTLAEATLALVLFADASRIDLRALRRDYGLPLRLLSVGLPLTIAAGAVCAALVFGSLSIAEAVVLAVLLAPTDAALGQAVVTEPRLPLRVRQGLNVESGLNDGICVPLLLIVLAVADVDAHTTSGHHAVAVVLEEIGYGVLGGIGAGVAAAAIVVVAGRKGLIADSWLRVIPVAAAALAYGIANPLGGSGFIAAFVAGLCFGRLVGKQVEGIAGFNEELGALLNGVTFVAFGAVLLGPALGEMTWEVVLYAILSLTVVRIVPVAVALLGSRARPQTVGFVGWFGPRGLASIVFAILVLQEAQLPHTDTILLATYVTVGLSVLLHGLSAAPLARRYADWYEAHPRNPMESRPVIPQRPRGPIVPAASVGAAEAPDGDRSAQRDLDRFIPSG
jgi:NhaP-type Na+/H+ or K+/H+ antiporter